MPAGNPLSRRIVACAIAPFALLIAGSALLPSAAARRLERKQANLVSLRRVPSVPTSDPAVVLAWPSDRPGPSRSVTMHVYLRLGVRLPRWETIQPLLGDSSSPLQGRTVLHVAFDPKNAGELRQMTAMATAVRSDSSLSSSLRMESFVRGTPALPHRILREIEKVEKASARAELERARRLLIEEVGSGAASARPVGTIIFEVEGRFYSEPSLSALASGPANMQAVLDDLASALCDPRIALP